MLGLVCRVVRVTQHTSSLQLSQHARLYATGHLSDFALRGCPGLGKDGSVAVVVVHAVEHEQVSMGIQIEGPTEELDGRDHPRGSLSDATFLAEASQQPGDLRAQDAHHRAEQSRAARHG